MTYWRKCSALAVTVFMASIPISTAQAALLWDYVIDDTDGGLNGSGTIGFDTPTGSSTTAVNTFSWGGTTGEFFWVCSGTDCLRSANWDISDVDWSVNALSFELMDTITIDGDPIDADLTVDFIAQSASSRLVSGAPFVEFPTQLGTSSSTNLSPVHQPGPEPTPAPLPAPVMLFGLGLVSLLVALCRRRA